MQTPEIDEMSKKIKEKLNEVDQFGKFILIRPFIIQIHGSLWIILLSVSSLNGLVGTM